MKHIYMILLAFIAASCAQLPPTPRDIEAKKFQTLPDKAVIYIVRPLVDGNVDGPLIIPGGLIATQQGTYYRAEVPPGTHRIAAAGAWSAAVIVQTEAGKIYFVEQTATGGARDGLLSMSLRRIDESRGRKMVTDAQLL